MPTAHAGAAPACAPRAPAIPQRVYIWQRVWTPAVCRSVREHAAAFAALDVLAGEISWTPAPVASAVAPNWSVLRATGKPVSLVVRIGPCHSAWTESNPETALVTQVCRRVLSDARAQGVEPVELQIDFDATATRLSDYERLLATLRRTVAPPRLVITTLPSWIELAEFRALIASVDAYVLQVHSLNKPVSSDEEIVLCSQPQARRWVEQASVLGRPFRVALPSYGYRVAFGATGEFLGLQAEGPPRRWPVGTSVRIAMADPVKLAALVQELDAASDRRCESLAWFRLPSDDDKLAWRWVTLEQVMAGAVPQPNLVVRAAPANDGTLDIVLTNAGTASTNVVAIALSWRAANLIAADAIGDWSVERTKAHAIGLRRRSDRPMTSLEPGATQTIGWLRLDAPADVAAVAQ